MSQAGPPTTPSGQAGDARTEMLSRVRAALADRPDPPPVTRDYRTAGTGSPSLTADAPQEALLDLLASRLVDYHALVRRATSTASPASPLADAAIASAVATALAKRGARRLIRPPGLPPAWLASTPGTEPVDDDPPLTAADLDITDGVLTGCALAIAETGTIVLDGGPGQGRRALTLVPDYHLVVVHADQVVAGVPDALARLDATGAPTRPLTWISGPSATSDIELHRVEGVHGPRTLEVILAG